MDMLSREPVVEYLKTLADESRLALLRYVYQEERTVGDLARLVDLGEPTVSHHLSRLREAGLVTLRMAGNQRFYRANPSGLARFKKMIAEIEQFPSQDETPANADDWIAALGWDPADQMVLRDYTSGGVLTNLPGKLKKMMVILRWLATLFEPERLYTEAEVNEVLKKVYAADFVSLRRDLVDMEYLRRDRSGSVYMLQNVNP